MITSSQQADGVNGLSAAQASKRGGHAAGLAQDGGMMVARGAGLPIALLVALLWVAATLSGCAMTPALPHVVYPNEPKFASEVAAPGGYISEEARSFVEFCVELDTQDDRYALQRIGSAAADGGEELKRLSPHIDPTLWNPEPIYDSRKELIADYFRGDWRGSSLLCDAAHRADSDPCFWSRDFERIETALAKGTSATEADVRDNPALNGFGPWQNAWLLFEGRGPNSGKHAIAIRGTVFASSPSAVADAYFQPVVGRHFLSSAVSFSRSDLSAMHSGFAHATFTLMLDRRYGVLQALSDKKIAPGSTLYIVGHSQGAGMATLAHGLIYQSMLAAENEPLDPLKLRGMKLRLKSYAFAQPKPGDFQFAAEFASYTQLADNAIVINNQLDPVPKVPLTLGSTYDLQADFTGQFFVARTVRAISSVGAAVRGGMSTFLEHWVRKSAERYGHYYNYAAIAPLGEEIAAPTWNFANAGRVLYVYGIPQADQSKDQFYQHHATTYRDLIAAQLP